MQMKKISEIAKKMGMDSGKMSRTIQRAEGNTDCFATTHVNDCNQGHCLWRVDCKAEIMAQADIPVAGPCI